MLTSNLILESYMQQKLAIQVRMPLYQTVFATHMYVTYVCNTHMYRVYLHTYMYVPGKILHPAQDMLQITNCLLQEPFLCGLDAGGTPPRVCWRNSVSLLDCFVFLKGSLALLLAKLLAVAHHTNETQATSVIRQMTSQLHGSKTSNRKLHHHFSSPWKLWIVPICPTLLYAKYHTRYKSKCIL